MQGNNEIKTDMAAEDVINILAATKIVYQGASVEEYKSACAEAIKAIKEMQAIRQAMANIEKEIDININNSETDGYINGRADGLLIAKYEIKQALAINNV